MIPPRLIAVGLAILVAGCGDNEGTISPSLVRSADNQRGRSEGVLVTSSRFPGSVAVGGSLPASVTFRPQMSPTWTSETPGVATVSGDGMITGVSPGASLIQATLLPAGAVPDPLATAAASVAVFPGLVELTLGGRHACARTSSLQVWCWGDDDHAELGQLADVESCQTPGGTFVCSMTPRRNLAALPFIQISAGEFRTCGLTASGEAYCWGANSGELGAATGTCAGGPCNPEPVKVSGSLQFSWIGTGDDFACGLTSAGVAYCMGLNDYGQLGSPTSDQCGSSTCSLVPLPVSGGLTFQSLTVRGYHACGLTVSGAAWCWGLNIWGELGDGTISAPFGGSSVPVEVSGGLQFASISAGKENTCALEPSGKAWCWGSNEGGQIGDGSSPSFSPDVAYSVPRAVSGALAFVSIAEGLQHVCGLTTTGEAWCWGANQVGQVGDGTMTRRLTPTRVSLNVALVEIGGGRNGTCGRTASERVYCWGTNLYGRLGIGTESPDRSVLPVGVGGVP